MRTTALPVLVALICSLAFVGNTEGAPTRRASDPTWVDGDVVVASSPDAVWQAVENVPSWRKIFSDIREMRITGRSTGRWKAAIDTTSMSMCGPHDYEFRSDAVLRTMEFRIDAPGLDVNGRLVVAPASTPTTASIRLGLRVRTSGLIGWFMPERTVRRRQFETVTRYAADLVRTFGAPTAVALGPEARP